MVGRTREGLAGVVDVLVLAWDLCQFVLAGGTLRVSGVGKAASGALSGSQRPNCFPRQVDCACGATDGVRGRSEQRKSDRSCDCPRQEDKTRLCARRGCSCRADPSPGTRLWEAL